MHQTTKERPWYFGMKAHLGVDSRTKLIHTVRATAANVADSAMLPQLLHGQETRVYGDQAYQGQTAVIPQCAPQARDFTQRRCRWRGQVDRAEQAKNRLKSKVRAKVEHAFGIIKNVFGFTKVRYRGLAKNLHRLEGWCPRQSLPGPAPETLRSHVGTGARPQWTQRTQRPRKQEQASPPQDRVTAPQPQLFRRSLAGRHIIYSELSSGTALREIVVTHGKGVGLLR